MPVVRAVLGKVPLIRHMIAIGSFQIRRLPKMWSASLLVIQPE